MCTPKRLCSPSCLEGATCLKSGESCVILYMLPGFVAALTSCQRAQRWQEALNCLGVMAGHGVACFATDVHFLEPAGLH